MGRCEPADADNIVGNWQQDRWSNGGSSGNLSAYSLNGGGSWAIPPVSTASDTGQAKFSRCTGGTAANGGDFERATDPWVSFSPNGVAHQVALGINDSNVANAVLTSRSSDKGARGALAAVGVAALIAVPHVVVDAGRFVELWLRRVKRVRDAPAGLAAAVDQSFHAVALVAVALLAAS